MVHPNELRIGSLVLNKHGQVISIECDDIVDAWHMPELYTPIQLTPEKLEKAGFKKKRYNDHYFCYCKGDFVFPYDGKYFFHCTYKEAGLFGYSENVEIMLHQFQNLIHALTGEELQIEL